MTLCIVSVRPDGPCLSFKSILHTVVLSPSFLDGGGPECAGKPEPDSYLAWSQM